MFFPIFVFMTLQVLHKGVKSCSKTYLDIQEMEDTQGLPILSSEERGSNNYLVSVHKEK